MLGLKTQESSKFNKFFGLVQNAAQKMNCVFFLDAGDGNDFENETMEGEDLMGWLIPEERISEFEPEWRKNNVSDTWLNFFVWAIWEDEKNPKISFRE